MSERVALKSTFRACVMRNGKLAVGEGDIVFAMHAVYPTADEVCGSSSAWASAPGRQGGQFYVFFITYILIIF